MRGTKAKRLRRENPESPFGRDRLTGRTEVTHPINPDLPSRAARRGTLKAYRQFVVRAARARDAWNKGKGRPTPAEPVREALKRQAGRYVDGDDGRSLQPTGPKRTRWKRWKGALLPPTSNPPRPNPKGSGGTEGSR